MPGQYEKDAFSVEDIFSALNAAEASVETQQLVLRALDSWKETVHLEEARVIPAVVEVADSFAAFLETPIFVGGESEYSTATPDVLEACEAYFDERLTCNLALNSRILARVDGVALLGYFYVASRGGKEIDTSLLDKIGKSEAEVVGLLQDFARHTYPHQLGEDYITKGLTSINGVVEEGWVGEGSIGHFFDFGIETDLRILEPAHRLLTQCLETHGIITEPIGSDKLLQAEEEHRRKGILNYLDQQGGV